MADNQFYDRGLPNGMVPNTSYPGELEYWDKGLPLAGLQSPASMDIVGTVTVTSGPTVNTGGAVGLNSLPLAGTVTVASGPTVQTGGTVGLASTAITGTVVVSSGPTVFSGGTVSFITPIIPVQESGAAVYGLGLMPRKSPNQWDRELQSLANVYKAIFAPRPGVVSQLGSLSGLSGLPGLSGLGYSPAGVQCAEDFQAAYRRELRKNFFERSNIVTPTTVSGTNVVVSFQCPIGYFGLILGYYCNYTGTGFVQGSGDIVYRLKIGGRWARNMGNLLFSVGDLQNPFPMPGAELVISGELVQFSVLIPNVSGNIQVGASRILCGLQGWFYPVPNQQRNRR